MITNTTGSLGYGLMFKDFALWGNSANQASGDQDGIKVSMDYGHIERVHIRYMGGNGLEFVGTSIDNQITNCGIYNCTNGLVIDTGVSDLLFTNLISGANLTGIRFDGGGSNCMFNGGHIYGGGGCVNLIYFDGGGTRCRFTGMLIESCLQHGIVLDVTDADISDVAFNGCNIYTSSQTTANTWDHVIVTRDSGVKIAYSPQFNSCTFGKITGNDCRYFINLPSYAYNAIVSGNRMNRSVMDTECVLDNTLAAYKALITGNQGYIARGEVRSLSGTISDLTQNYHNSVDNPFGQDVLVLDETIYVTTGATATSPNIDCGIGSSATTDYVTLFDDLPGETPGVYHSVHTATFGKQTTPILWQTGTGNRYLNHSIKDAAATGMVATYTIRVMGV
jgi:hypothetical protein